MKDFIKENEDILEEWRLSNEGYGEFNFASDGIMYKGEIIRGNGYISRDPDENKIENYLWSTAPLRVLFLTKDQNTGGDDAWDVRSEFGRKYMESDSIQYAFFRNLMYLLYGICHTTDVYKAKYDFSNQDAIDFFDKYPFARINVKKEGGSCSISNSTLSFYLNRDGELIKKQIQHLNPDIIFCCGYSESIEETGNLLLNFLNSNGYNFVQVSRANWIYYDEVKNKIAINSWHLSARISSQTFFDELMQDYYSFLRSHTGFLFRIKENRLFRRWKDEVDTLEDKTSKFCKDGVVNPDIWFKQQTRILLLLKDVNDKENNINEWWSLTDNLSQNPSESKDAFLCKRVATWGNVAKWIYGIMHKDEHPDWNIATSKCGNSKARYHQLQKVAIVNLKKIPGGDTCPDIDLEEFFKKDYNKGYFVEQIQMYHNLDYIICCGPKVEELFFDEEILRRCFGQDIQIIPRMIKTTGGDNINCRIINGKIKLIGFYHPQPSNGKEFAVRYSTLMNVIDQLSRP